MRLVNWRTLIAGAASIALVACGDDVTVVQPVPTLTLNPASVSCTAGTNTAVGVTVGGATGTPQVTFTPSGTGFTVTGSGTGATVNCTAAGAGVITVAVTANGQTVTGSIPVTVAAAPLQVQAVSVSPNQATIAVGASVTLTPSVITAPGAPASASAVTYTSLQTNIATVDANGVVRGVAPGQATIRIASTAVPSIVATATITVVPTSAFVQSLTVNPTNVTLQTGATQTVASTVTLAPGAPAGTSQAVTYTSSDTTVARISSTGVITAVRNGTAVITVASQAAPTVTQSISVTVRDPAPVRLTIQSTRVINGAGNIVPADLNNVAGNLFVTLNLDPGDFRPDSVRLRLGSQIVNCQRFSAALAAAYREALTTGAADVQAIECQLNTAQFDTLTGAVRVTNGAQPLTAEVFFRPQGAAAGTQTQRADIPLQLTVNNQSGFFTRVTNALPTGDARAAINANGRALGPDGRTWLAGDIRVTILPVLFQAGGATGPLQTVSVTLTDPNLPGGQATQVANATGNTGATTLTFPGASADAPAGNNTVTGFTSTSTIQAGLGATTAGTVVTLGAVGGNAGTAFLTQAGAPVAGAFTVNIDNQTPEARTINVPTQFTQGNQGQLGFLSAGFSFADSLTISAATTVNGDNGGVDRVTFAYFVGAATDPSDANIIATGTRATTGASLPPAITNNANRAVAVLADALGNSRRAAVFGSAGTPFAATNFTFGVDLVAPTIASLNNSAIQRRGSNFTNNVSFSAQVSDDVSGFNLNELVGRITRQDPTNGLVCVTPSAGNSFVDGAATISAPTGGVIGGCPLVPLDIQFGLTTGAPRGEYRFDVAARDVAGNVSAFSTRRAVFDPAPPTIGGISLPATLGNNAVATFTSSAADDFDLQSAYGVVGYGASGITLRLEPTVTLGTSFDNVFTTSAAISLTTTGGFIRSVTSGASNNTGTTSATLLNQGNATNPATAIAIIALDAGNNRAFAQASIPLANLGTVPGAISSGSAVGVDSVRVTLQNPSGTAVGSIINGNLTTSLNTTATPNPSSTTVVIDAFGPTGTFNFPFQRVEIWTTGNSNAVSSQSIYNPGQNLAAPFTSAAYRFFQTVSTAATVSDPGISRRIRYTTSITAASIDPGSGSTSTTTFVVVGVTPAGDAVVSVPFSVTVSNP